MRKLLWLDDIRNPFESNWVQRFSPISNPEVIWVNSYTEFTNYIIQNGLPDAICFDHDLGDISENEKTGYDCAKYIVDYCLDNDLDIPKFNIQSDNGPGGDNIRMLLNNYHKFYISKG